MFRNRAASACVGIVLAALLGPAARAEEESPVVFMAEALGNVADVAQDIGENTPFGYDDGISLLGGLVRRGGSVSLNRFLKAGRTYGFVGHGDRDVVDIDIDIFDAVGNLVASDRKPAAAAAVAFTPPRAGEYTITLRLDRCRDKWSFCAMAILRDQGWTVPKGNLIDAAGRCVTQGLRAMRDKGWTRFVAERNNWSLFGGVVRQGDSISLGNVCLGGGPRLLFATADDHAQDIDLFLMPHDREGVVGKDDDRDAMPVFACQTQAQTRYDIRLKNERSCHPSLMFAAALGD